MTPTIATTRSDLLELSIIEAIRTITPTHPHDRDDGWAPATDNRLAGVAGQRARVFEIQIAPGRTVERGLTGGNGVTEKELRLDVVVDYRAFEPQEVGTIVESDQWDLYERLCSQLDGSLNGAPGTGIPGLTHVEDPIGPVPSGDAESRMTHQFTIFYLRQR